MASRIAGITIQIGGDTTKLQSSLKGVDKSLRQTQSALKDVNKLLKFNPGNTELLIQKQRNLKKAVDDTKERLRELKKTAENVTPEDIGQDKYDALQREIIETENKLEDLEKEYKSFGSVGLQKVSAVGKKMQELGGKIKGVGTNLSKYVTAPIVALGGVSMAAWNEVDDALDTVTKKTGASGDALKEMQDQVRDIATSMPTTFEDAGVAVGEVNTRFGLTGDALQDLSEDFIKFAKINDTDVNNSIDTIQSAMAAFNTETDKASGVLDLFTAAGQQTGVPLESLAETVKKNATALQEMGLGLEDSVMFLAQLDKSGVDSTTVLAGLKKAFQNAAKQGKPMNEALSELQDNMKNASSDAEAAQYATELFGTRAGAAIAEYVRNGQLDFEALGVSMEEYAGTVSKTYEETLDPIDELTTAMNQMKDLGYEIGEAAAPIIVETLTVLKDVITELKAKWDELTPAQQDMIVKFALVAAAVGPVLVVVGQLVSIIGAVIAAAPVMGAALAALTGPGAIVIGIIGAVIAAGVLLGQHWDEVCAWANNLKEKVSGAISEMKQRVSDSIEQVKTYFSEMKNKVSNIMAQVKQDISNKIEAAKQKVSSAVQTIKDKMSFVGLAAKVSSVFSSVKSGISDKMNAAKDAVSGAIERIKGILSGTLSFPHIEVPHFHISGGVIPWGIGGKGTPPSVSVEWYAKAMRQPYILDGATIFGAQNGRLLGGGERGKEVIMGYDLYRNLRGSDVNINMVVNAAPGMDVTELANVVSRKINKQVRELGAVW